VAVGPCRIYFVLVEPFYLDAFVPDASTLVASFVYHSSLTVHLPFLPAAFVDLAIVPLVDSEAVFFVILVRACVSRAIAVLERAHAIELIVMPVPLVTAPVWPLIFSVPLYLVLRPVAIIVAAVRPERAALSLLDALRELSFVTGAVLGQLDAFAFEPELYKVANLGICVSFSEFAVPLSLVVFKLSFKFVSVFVDECPCAACMVVHELTGIFCTRLPLSSSPSVHEISGVRVLVLAHLAGVE